jgi:hypothetical protein
MKKYLPYIVILLLTYLVAGFIRMQFNPAYWEKDARIAMIVISIGVMILYPIIKWQINEMKE